MSTQEWQLIRRKKTPNQYYEPIIDHGKLKHLCSNSQSDSYSMTDMIGPKSTNSYVIPTNEENMSIVSMGSVPVKDTPNIERDKFENIRTEQPDDDTNR